MTIEDLLLPDTPESVRRAYLSLPERAATADFGLLEEDVVVLDTETTGLSVRTCGLIEIAAVRLAGRQVQDRYHSFVHPGMPIPPEIRALTGISDLDVTDAPSPEEAVAGLADFVGGSPVLAHNATFDRSFIEAVHGGSKVSDLWIDPLALSRIALPRLSSHRLADMAEAFGCASVSHRAMDDVEALAGMWRVMLCALSDLPAGLLSLMAGMHEEVDWCYRPVLTHLALAAGDAPLSMPAVRRELLSGTADVMRVDALERVPLWSPTKAEVEGEFGADGIVGRMYGQFERRPEQVAMAEHVRRALATSSHRCIEAGTGVGKSVAYLLPLALFAKGNGITCGVATKTNALTDQLVSHELPALAREVPGGLTFFSLKGYEHYPCLRRVMHSVDADLPVDQAEDRTRTAHAIGQDMLTAIAVTLSYAAQSPSGDLDSLGIRWRSVPRHMLVTTPDECQRTRCPFYPNLCLVHGARRRAAAADIVVTNHSLLLANVVTEGRVLPPIRHWVVDEAPSLEAEARRQWAVEVSASRSRAAFEAIGGTRSGTIHQLLSQATQVEGSTLLMGLLAKAAASVSRASVAMGELFDAVAGLVAIAPRGGYDAVTVWLGPEARETPEWARVSEAGEHACFCLDEAIEFLEEAVGKLGEATSGPAADAGDDIRVLKDLDDAIRVIVDGTDTSYVYSAEVNRNRARGGQERLLAEKVDVGAELAQRWLPEVLSACFTSATIAVGDDFSHFEHSVGLDQLEASSHESARLDSSFDFDRNMRVVVARDIPQPNDPRYLERLADLLFDVHVAMGGSVLTLFTNRREMEGVYKVLQPRLADVGLDLACQDRGGTRQLRERFIAEKSLSLLALKSFWEGFDAAGDTLRCVVIPKLPFANPNDPIGKERERREDRAWWRYCLPEAVLSVKQAAGRLIRTSTDQGILVLADSRLKTKSYGRQFISSLPSRSVVELETRNIRRFIETWRKGLR